MSNYSYGNSPAALHLEELCNKDIKVRQKVSSHFTHYCHMLDDPDDFNEEHFQNAQKIYKYLKGKELQYNK